MRSTASRLAKRGPFFNWAGESQYYTEPERLAKLGYLSARKEPGKTRERTVYTPTDKGLDTLRNYARTAVAFTLLKSDVLLRLLICDLACGERDPRALDHDRPDVGPLSDLLEDSDQLGHQLERQRVSFLGARERDPYRGPALDASV